MRSEKILPFKLELICSVLLVVQQQNQNNMKEMKRTGEHMEKERMKRYRNLRRGQIYNMNFHQNQCGLLTISAHSWYFICSLGVKDFCCCKIIVFVVNFDVLSIFVSRNYNTVKHVWKYSEKSSAIFIINEAVF